MKEAIEVWSIIIGFILCIYFIGAGFKTLASGHEKTQGIVLAARSNVLNDCIKISQTTQGESSNVTYCVFRNIKIPKLGEQIEIDYYHSKLPFKDNMTITTIKEAKNAH